MLKEIEAYENLGNAIIQQAVVDWLACTDKDKDGKRVHPHDSRINREEIEKFFHSQWFGTLSKVDPDWLIEKLKAIDKKKQKRSYLFTYGQY